MDSGHGFLIAMSRDGAESIEDPEASRTSRTSGYLVEFEVHQLDFVGCLVALEYWISYDDGTD